MRVADDTLRSCAGTALGKTWMSKGDRRPTSLAAVASIPLALLHDGLRLRASVSSKRMTFADLLTRELALGAPTYVTRIAL
jgi:hypothetical protein